MSGAEFSHWVEVRHLPVGELALAASPSECAALARRFGLVSVGRLEAKVTLAHAGEAVQASCKLTAGIVQSCAISGEDLPVAIAEPVLLRFVPEAPAAAGSEEEIELSANDCDEIAYSGTRFDLGEALAQSLALAIDPFAIGPDAAAARKRAGIVSEGEAGPFAALTKLKKGE